MARVLIISSSARTQSNSEKLCRRLASGVADAGGEAVIQCVGRMNIAPCRGCDFCRGHDHVCAIEDDMVQVLEQMKLADALVLATPIYFWNVSAQLKAVWDRTFALHPYEELTRIKRAALITTAGLHREHTLDAVIAGYKGYLWCMGGYCDRIENAGMINVDRVYQVHDIDEHPALQEAYALGRKLAR